MKKAATPLVDTEQALFNGVFDAAANGIEGAVRAYVSGDYMAARKHLDSVELGVSIIHAWLDRHPA